MGVDFDVDAYHGALRSAMAARRPLSESRGVIPGRKTAAGDRPRDGADPDIPRPIPSGPSVRRGPPRTRSPARPERPDPTDYGCR